MFERYTEKARRVIFFARYEASQYGSPYIETEHLLLGLLREDKALANRFLRPHGSIESIRREIEARITIRERISTSVEVPLSQECKRILNFATEEAERLSHKHVGTEHLLLGILREDKCFAAEILQERNLRLSTLREELSRAAGEKVPVNRPKETSLLAEFSRDLTQGAIEGQLDPLVGTTVRPDVAIYLDWENRWAIEDMQALGRDRRNYTDTVIAHYLPFWKRGIPVDVIAEEAEISQYKLVIAPMLYMLKPGVAERIRTFVEKGGTLVMTYWSGIVDENDLCFLGGWPGNGLREVLGIWDEETDTITPEERNRVLPAPGNELGLSGSFEARDYFALIHAEGARVLATFGSDFYAGRPALTVNDFGKGQAFYVASRNDEAFMDSFFGKLAERLDLLRALPAELPEGVTAQMRSDGQHRFIFVMNFNPAPATVDLGAASYRSLLSGQSVTGPLGLPAYGVEVLQA